MRQRDKEYNMRKKDRTRKEEEKRASKNDEGTGKGKTKRLGGKRNTKGGRAFVWRMRVKCP